MKNKFLGTLPILLIGLSLAIGNLNLAYAATTPTLHTDDSTQRTGLSTTPSVSKPANLQPEDLIVVFLMTQNIDNNISSIPTGFVEIGSYGSTAANHPHATAYYKIATDSEPTEYNFTLSASEAWRMYITRVTNYDISDPIDQVSGAVLQGAGISDSITIPSLTPSADTSLLVAGKVVRLAGSGTDTVPTGMTLEYQFDTNPTIQIASQQLLNADPTGDKTFSWSGDQRAAAMMFTINPYPSDFAAETVTSTNLADIATSLLNSDRPNILFLGDSVAVSQTWNASRWPTGFMRAFETDAGYNSVTAGAADPPGSSAFIDVNLLATFGGDSAYERKLTSEDYWGDNSFFGSIWHSQDFVANIGATGYVPGAGGSMISWQPNSSSFDLGQTSDWFTDNNLSMQFGYLYDSAINYATGFDLNNGLLGFSKTYDPSTSADVLGGVLRDKGLNLISDKINVDDSNPLVLANVTGSDDRFLSGAVVKLTNEDNDDGIALATLAQSSASYANTYQDSAPVLGDKQFSQADLVRYLQSAFTRNNTDNYVLVAFAAEPGTVSNQVTRVNSMIDSVESAYSAAGMSAPEFILISTWRTNNNDSARIQAEVFDTVAKARSNVAMVSMYGLTDGLYLDGVINDQAQWASDNGYDNIALNSGTLDVSSQRLIDTGAALHQNSESAAFFFAYLLDQEIRAEGSILPPAPTVTSGGSGIAMQPITRSSSVGQSDSDDDQVITEDEDNDSNVIISILSKVLQSNLPANLKQLLVQRILTSLL